MDDVLVCVTVTEADEPSVIGSEERECERCGNAIWVSPSGLKKLDEEEVTALCASCAVVYLKDGIFGESVQLEELSDEQMAEIAEAGGEELLAKAMGMIKALQMDGGSRAAVLGSAAAAAVRLHPLFGDGVKVIVMIRDDGESCITTGGYPAVQSGEVVSDITGHLQSLVQDMGGAIHVIPVPHREDDDTIYN